MAIVREHGTPDLFVTMTCNATWPEIVNNLKPGQTASDRPDMVAKVFKLKLAEFMDDIVKKGVVGKVRAYVNVIEFQKRGLPHVHMLLILEEPYKLRTAEDVDSLVWAELPDPEQYPRLHEIVKKMMMHGPCGPGTRSPCMEKFKTRCSKRFPKDYSEETVLEENQIPRYRRRESAPSFEGRGGVKMDSRWVVPYNPYLMTKYNAHINVEICTSVRCVKYLFKYIYKGHDKANVFICESGAVETEQPRDRLDHDEVKNFTDARYVGAPEAAWRLKKYSMQDKSHHIERLAVHLQGEQLVYSRETEDNERVMERAEESETTLTAWFALNQRDPNARQYLYGDIPRHYTWNKKDKKWQPRQAHFNVIGRMYVVNPRESERYRMRLLLLNVRGAQSFEDLRTVRTEDENGNLNEVVYK
ncbi:hypothetical protein QR680_013035 [Steinernema hermaphroditum]|uniref:Helitron helicase-like domain-containing protein n=1 Tax=Steinernema hermaphroditum TaxID=289476 RepID=A0AA39M1L2_9BILA|nr:hypothetical protein QR680_013035 [Steinernema hermaphroditum]